MDKEPDIRQQVLKSTLEEVKASADTTDGHDPCVICLDSITERAVASPCRHHSFDFLCLVSWLDEQPKCPLCKADVRNVEFDWQSPTDFKVYELTPKHHVVPAHRPSLVEHHRRVSVNSAATLEQHRIIQHNIRASRIIRRHEYENRQRPQLNPDAALIRRKQIYCRQLYSSHVGSNRLSRFRDLTPQLFSQDEGLISRARKWIRRELQVFEFLKSDSSEAEGVSRRANNAEFLLEYIVAILRTVDIKGSGGQAEDMLQEFLGGANTRLFLHELRAWLRSPYLSLEDWDRHVQYNEDPMRASEDAVQLAIPDHQDRSTIPKCRKGTRTSGGLGDRYAPYRRGRDARAGGPDHLGEPRLD